MGLGPVTLLFTDLVNSTELLARAGDEQAQRIFQAHHRLLKRCVDAHDGEEVKWLGDGLMTVFASTADAVRCAIAMQQAARRRAAGERLSIRVGLNVGEVKREESDYFGTPVVIARRLCDRADAGQILCSAVVPGLLAGQSAFAFGDCGPIEIKGLATPVSACEVLYRQDQPTALLTHTPFVGRVSELARLEAKLYEARAGHGGLAMLAGEPGIGKTRTLEEFAETARSGGAQVLWGRCYEGEAARPYGPFAEAIADYARSADAGALAADLGIGAAPLARLIPALRERLPDIPEPATLQPDEERVRLLDAAAQFLIALSARAPLVLVLDDLHWADGASIALLRHIARFAARHRLLLLGAYRDVEVGPLHPLLDALGALPRETTYEHLALGGLTGAEVEKLLEAVADEKVAGALVNTISAETSGNPFFIREVLLHLVEEGKIVWRENAWTAQLTAEQVGIPQGLRQVIQRRLTRLSEQANRLLRAASGFSGSFRFDVVARVAQLDEGQALDAIDDALAAQLLCAANAADSFDFTHALVRHALYAELSPPRQTRLHRQIAETMELVYGGNAAAYAGQIAQHYHRSATLAGAERGGEHALVAADRATAAYAQDEAAAFLTIALDLLPRNDPRRPRLLGRLGLSLSCMLQGPAAVEACAEAARLISAAEGSDPAGEFLAGAVLDAAAIGLGEAMYGLADQGLSLLTNHHSLAWAVLKAAEIRLQEISDPEYPGVPCDSPERREVAAILDELDPNVPNDNPLLENMRISESRQKLLARGMSPRFPKLGELRGGASVRREEARRAEEEGRLSVAASSWIQVSRYHNALGDLGEAAEARRHGTMLAEKIPEQPFLAAQRIAAEDESRMVLDDGWNVPAGIRTKAKQASWYRAGTMAAIARSQARMGGREQALECLQSVLPALERAPGWAEGYVRIACDLAETLWLTEDTDHIDTVERNLRAKVVEPDFRALMRDGRLALARLCALRGDHDEAVQWFAQARVVLDEQGARPLRAIADFDEALMYQRRGAPGDVERTQPFLNSALRQFRALGMTGWIRRGEALRARALGEDQLPSAQPGADNGMAATAGDATDTTSALRAVVPSAEVVARFWREGDYWTIVYAEATSRLRDMKGLAYLSQLLRHPGRELHALDLIRMQTAENPVQAPVEQGLEVLDPQAKTAYRRRLEELRAELEEAEEFNDTGRAERAREEMEAIGEHLASAVGLGGRDRKSGSAAERARMAVTQRVRSAIKRIAEQHPALADHLAGRIETGTFCVYRPDPTRPIEWDLG